LRNGLGDLLFLVALRIIAFPATQGDDAWKRLMPELPMRSFLSIQLKTRPIQITDQLTDFAWHKKRTNGQSGYFAKA
jgi:hypothetical protein